MRIRYHSNLCFNARIPRICSYGLCIIARISPLQTRSKTVTGPLVVTMSSPQVPTVPSFDRSDDSLVDTDQQGVSAGPRRYMDVYV